MLTIFKMKRAIFTISFAILFVNVFSQSSKVSDIKVNFLDKNSVLKVTYSVIGDTPLYGVCLSIETPFETIIPQSLSGDVGDSIMPGKNRTIEWNFENDNIFWNNMKFNLSVCSNNAIPLCTSTSKISSQVQNDNYLMLLLGGAKFGSIGNWGWYTSCHYTPDNYDFSVPFMVGISKRIAGGYSPNTYYLYAGAGFEFEMTTICFDWGFMYRHKSLLFNLGMGVSDFDEFYPTVGIGWVFK